MRIYLRADGDPKIGLGHLHRMSALGEMLVDWDYRFLSRADWQPAYGPAERWLTLPSECSNEEMLQKIREAGTGLAVLDGYDLAPAMQKQISQTGCAGLFVDDDRHCSYNFADYVLSHVGGVEASQFQSATYTVFFLGIQYALIRPLFRPADTPRSTESSTLLISLGGSDLDNRSKQVLLSIPPGKFSRVELVVGGANPHEASLRELVHDLNLPIRLHKNLSATEMLALYRTSGWAVLSPSTVSYEYLASGGGGLGLFLTQRNQSEIFKFFLGQGAACSWEQLWKLQPDQRETQTQIQRHLFQGSSQENLQRIVQAIAALGQVQELPSTVGRRLRVGGAEFQLCSRHETLELLLERHQLAFSDELAIAFGRALKFCDSQGLGRIQPLVKSGDPVAEGCQSHVKNLQLKVK